MQIFVMIQHQDRKGTGVYEALAFTTMEQAQRHAGRYESKEHPVTVIECELA